MFEGIRRLLGFSPRRSETDKKLDSALANAEALDHYFFFPDQTNLEAAAKLVKQYEKDANEAPKLREQVARLEHESTKLQKELDEKTAIAEMADGKKNAETIKNLNMFRYLTLFCGVLSLLLAMGVGYLYTRPLQAPDSEHPVAEPEPHRIP